ncbi:MAG: hemerythrin domain-containing protein [Caldisphaera sp.]
MIAVTLELQDEHVFISDLNKYLKNYKNNLNDKKNLQKISKILFILSNYVSKCHHKKEKKFIFPYLINKSGEEASLANEMMNQHRIIENLENQLESSLNMVALKTIDQKLLDLITILDSHIQEENTVVFAYAEISIDEKEKILNEINEFEKENPEFCNKDKYQKILNQLQFITFNFFIKIFINRLLA